jgi:formylmethanofuran dehydrogenase subunit E
MVTFKQRKEKNLDTLLRKAVDLHGHFGPFLVLGVRMGLAGLRELQVRGGDPQLRVNVLLKYTPPVSCLLDGIQTTTKCTVGNKRLVWKESKKIEAFFQLINTPRQVKLSVNSASVEEWTHKLDTKLSDKEVHQLALDAASRSEKQLFLVRPK